MSKFEVTKSVEGNRVSLQVLGQIDEDSDFSLHPITDAQYVDVHLGGITGINSCGIREWIKWFDTMKLIPVITFHKCPKIIVDQMNMVEGFLPSNATVESFFVPYYSEDSGNEKDILFVRGKDFDEKGINALEEITDEASGDTLEMDVIEAKYFKFLKN